MIHHGCSIKVFRGTPVSWLITSGYCRVFFRMSDIKSLWLTDPLWQDGRSGGCMALWTVSSSSSLMSWVVLTASPGHSMYMCFLNIADGHIQSWTQPAEGHLAWLEKASFLDLKTDDPGKLYLLTAPDLRASVSQWGQIRRQVIQEQAQEGWHDIMGVFLPPWWNGRGWSDWLSNFTLWELLCHRLM